MLVRLALLLSCLSVWSAAAWAAEIITVPFERFTLRAVVAPGEFLVHESRRGPDGRPRYRLEQAGSRAAALARARALRASGEASDILPVLYLDGRLGDPQARAYASRRILLLLQPVANADAVAADHGLRLAERIADGMWIAEPRAADPYASVEAVRHLGSDRRVQFAQLLFHRPVTTRLTPNDPIVTDGHAWHLDDAPPGIRIREVWDDYRGSGINIAINDDGVQSTHPDLDVRSEYSFDYLLGVRNGNPKSTNDNHGTVVAGLAAARGNNGLGTAGVAFAARIIASRIINNSTAVNALTLAPDDQLRQALLVQLRDLPTERTWVSNNSWGVPDSGMIMDGAGPLITGFTHMRLGLQEGVFGGRGNAGIVYVWSAGNGGLADPNGGLLLEDGSIFQDCAAFDAFLNRFTIPVAALKHPEAAHPSPPWYLSRLPPFYKAEFSESGPNLIISAPGGEEELPQPGPSPRPWGLASTDRTGEQGMARTPNEFDDPIITDPALNPVRPYENGDYVSPRMQQLSGTSYAAAIVSGCVALMLEARPELSWRDVRAIMQHRGQDVRPPAGPIALLPHDDWGQWRANAAGLLYNNWYGFGAVDMGRFIYGGDGARAQLASAGARDEPGALCWPLYPPLLASPLRYRAEFPRPTNTRDDPDLYAIFDAPEYPVYQDLVPDGRARYPHYGRDENGNVVTVSRWCQVPMTISGMPPGFRIDAVEITVELEGLGPNAYPGGAPQWQRMVRDDGTVIYEALPGKPRFQGPTGNTNGFFHWGDYLFRLRSPNGTEAILGRQRPGRRSFAHPLLPGDANVSEKWTFTEFFHANETDINGTWVLRIIDERNNVPPDPDADPQGFILADGTEVIAGNPPQARVRSVDLQIWGHVAYPVPRLQRLHPTGLPLNTGAQTLRLLGSGFALSQGQVPVSQVYWQPLRYDSTAASYVPDGDPVELPFTYVHEGEQRVTLSAEFLTADRPKRGVLFVANPAIVVGRAGGGDAFDEPNVLLPSRVASPNFPEAPATRRMKRNPPEDDRLLKLSRPPTVTPISDAVIVPGASFMVSTQVDDPDVAAGLPADDPERLQVRIVSLNQDFLPNSRITVQGPGGDGRGTYIISGTPVGSIGFAVVQVIASDGAVETVRNFRVVIPSTRESRGCGGGMGLALLVVPLAIWIWRRRAR